MPELYDTVAKKTYPLDGIDELYIGRGAPEGHLRTLLGLKGVSRRHARVFRKEDMFWAGDLESQFGTWVDEMDLRVSGPVKLKNGSTIDLAKIGYYPIIYREKGPEEGNLGPLEKEDSGLLDLKDEIDELSDKEFFERFG